MCKEASKAFKNCATYEFVSYCSLKLFFRFGEGFGDAVMFKFEM